MSNNKSNAKHTMSDLYQMQGMSLDNKIKMTKRRIHEWVDEFGIDGVYVSFSGGKDSTVLLHMAREEYPDMKAAFVDTGLEYPEIRRFVKQFDNVDFLKPKKTFKKIIQEYGYPFISKETSGIIGGGQRALQILDNEGICTSDKSTVIEECAKRMNKAPGEWRRLAQCYGAVTKTNIVKENLTKDEKGYYSDIPKKYKFMLEAPFFISDKCCSHMKKNPVHNYYKETGRHPITAQMATESRLRTRTWMLNGCNGFHLRYPISNPMSFWTEQDVYMYIWENKTPICSVYGDVVVDQEASGQLEGQMSFRDLGGEWELFDTDRPILKTTGLYRTGCMFCGYGCHLEKQGEGRFETMKETHPKQYEYIMKPCEEGGLNYKAIIDWMNENGGMNIRY